MTGVDDGRTISPTQNEFGRRRHRRRRWAAAAALLLVAGLLAVGAVIVGPHSCRWFDFDLTRSGGQCVGLTDGSYVFSPEIAKVSALIADENRWVRKQTADGGKTYVSVALLMPMTATPGSPLSDQQIRVSLEGAYSAQRRANHSHDILDPVPLIQLLLVNEGSHQSQWPTAVDTLIAASDSEHPVLAVIGLGVSLPSSQQAANRLDTAGFSMVGAVLAANNLAADHLFEAGASTLDYAKALLAYTEDLDKLNSRRVLVFDDSDDYFTQTLSAAFQAQFGSHIQHRETFRGQAAPDGATPDLFAHIVQNICLARADQVLFAGRFRDLEVFARALAARSCLSQGEVAVYTVGTGLSSLFTDEFEHTVRDGLVKIHFASNTDAEGWTASRAEQAPGYEPFHRIFVDQLGFREEDLRNGYSIMHHDAMMTAVWAIRLAPLQAHGVPVREDVFQMLKALHGVNAIPAASGTLSFTDASGWPSGKLIPIQHYPNDNVDVDPTTPYLTEG
jgi:ABC-type branched-subunit amino acid transport system substrate-binding protein